MKQLGVLGFFKRLRWLGGVPLLSKIEPYRQQLFVRFCDERDADGRPAYNLGLFGRAKKNWKTADLVLAAAYALFDDSAAGNQVYLVANDAGQAADDLALLKKLLKANPALNALVRVKTNIVERRDGNGFIEVLPAQDVAGSHGKTFRFLGVDEIHGQRNWDLLEALAPDPTRSDTQTWITSYASLFHRPGIPLFDLMAAGKAGADPKMLFSWYAADHCTDPAFADQPPEARANPSMASWGNPGYLAQQQQRLPAHKYRRLHFNLPGLPEGSAFSPEPVMDAIARGVVVRAAVPGVDYRAFVDMSGGSSDDAVLAIGHLETDGRATLDLVIDQGPRPPFDPNKAVERFVLRLKEYKISRVAGDRYAGQTFRAQFEGQHIAYDVADHTTSALYEALEPLLNSHRVVLLDVPTLEQQLLGLVWRGGKIDHQPGEHDDHATAVAGVVVQLATGGGGKYTALEPDIDRPLEDYCPLYH